MSTVQISIARKFVTYIRQNSPRTFKSVWNELYAYLPKSLERLYKQMELLHCRNWLITNHYYLDNNFLNPPTLLSNMTSSAVAIEVEEGDYIQLICKVYGKYISFFLLTENMFFMIENP